MRKDLAIVTNPPGAQVTINGETLGTSPITYAGWAFPVKPDTGEFIPQKVAAIKPGYDPAEISIGWDDGRKDYSVDLPIKNKSVRIASYPPGAEIRISGVEAKPDAEGVLNTKLAFPPVDEKGTFRTYSVSAVKPPGETSWEPLQFTLHWDEGKTDYTLPLKEIKTRPVALLRAKPTFADQGWQLRARAAQHHRHERYGGGPDAQTGLTTPYGSSPRNDRRFTGRLA